ncbi:hypothetical protein AAMO2058_001018400 [Amorphochlora amoebiformis]
MASTPFFLSPPAPKGAQVTYKVHPLVVFNILDHYRRREPKQHRVVGTLLGETVKTVDGVKIHIKNSFPIPHADFKGDEVSIDFEYHKNMAALQKKLSQKESVVGWYSTGNAISYTTPLIHEVLCRRVKNGIHLMVDTLLTKNRLTVKGYIGRTIKMEGKEVVGQFEPVECEFATTEPARIAVDAMINGVPDDKSVLDAPATMLSELESLERSLQELLHLLETVSEFVDKVVKSEEKGTHVVGSAIKDALTAVPSIDPERFTRIFNQKTEDLLMILYLSNITRAQVALGNRIYEVLD